MSSSPKTSRWDSTTTTALITALVGLVGVTLGYYGNKQLQSSQTHISARGAARVLQADFAAAAVRIEVELKEKRLIAPEPSSVGEVSEENEKLIASNVGSRAWEEIAPAKLVTLDEIQEAEAPSVEMIEARKHEFVPLRGARLRSEEVNLRMLDSAAVALKTLAGTESTE